MRKLALLLSLLAFGALGLVACGGGDDEEATAASATETTDDGNPYDYDELAADPADNKSCANPGGRGLTVVQGDFSCREARRLMHRVAYNRVPYQWRCIGPEGATGGYEVCTNLPGTSSRIVIKVRFGRRAENKSCRTVSFYQLTVVEGDISCRAARRVILLLANNSLPGSWSCTGRDADVVCTKEPAASPGIVIMARFASEAAALEVDPARKNPFVARRTVTEEGVRFSFRVPIGWERFSSISTDKSAGGPISINKSRTGPQGAEAIIFWTSFPDGDYANPCAHLLKTPVGSSAAGLAAAVSTAPGTKLLTGPSNVTLGGRPAKHVTLTLREDVGCDPGFLYTWRDVYGGALWPKTGVGDTIRVWIVDVHGTRLFIEAETAKGFSRDLEQEVQQIVESISFE